MDDDTTPKDPHLELDEETPNMTQEDLQRQKDMFADNRLSTDDVIRWMPSQKKATDPKVFEDSDPDDGPQKKPEPKSQNIFIVGFGSVGKFMAHSLKGIPSPPRLHIITHRPRTRREWFDSDRLIRCTTDGVTIARGGYIMEYAVPNPRYHKGEVLPEKPLPPTMREKAIAQDMFNISPEEFAKRDKEAQERARRESENMEQEDSFQDPELQQNDETYPKIDIYAREAQNSKNIMIDSLIVCVKTIDTVSALSPLQHRLDHLSTIIFMHNGIGVIADVNEHIFPDPARRPTYLLGVNSHGVKTNKTFDVTHAGQGTIAVGPYPLLDVAENTNANAKANETTPPLSNIEDPAVLSRSARYLIRTLLRTPVLKAAAFPTHALLALQLEKLAVNAVINPLTALLDVRNGMLVHSADILRMSRLLIAEVSMVIRHIPALAALPSTANKFSARRLESLWLAVAHKTRHNVSSMLADVRWGRKTEIAHINGWVVQTGHRLGVTCVSNYGVMKMVEAKAWAVGWERAGEMPFFQGPDISVRREEDIISMRQEDTGADVLREDAAAKGGVSREEDVKDDFQRLKFNDPETWPEDEMTEQEPPRRLNRHERRLSDFFGTSDTERPK